MRPYPAYKDSGVEWLGEVPEGWGLTPLRSEFDERTYKNDGLQSENYLSLVAGRGVMPYAEKGDMGNKMPEDLEKCKIVSRGNFVINSMNFGIGAFGLSAYNGICSPVYVVLDAKIPESLQFLNWIFQVGSFQLLAQSFGNGILAHRAAIGWDVLKLMLIPLPPLSEQQAIARFLDKEVAKIDALVAEQRRLIALLAEKRQAVISHAVTKGLNPATPLKPSGIDWLGDIPEGWEVVPLGRLVSLNPSKSEVAHRSREEEVSFLPMEAVGQDGSLDLSRTRPIGEVETGYTYLREGDVAFAKITPCFENGKGALMRGLAGGIAFGTTELTVLRPSDERLSNTFLACVVSSPIFLRLGEGHMYGAGGQKRVPDDFAREFRIALPSRAEQDSIVEHIKATHERFDALTAAATSAISLLQERRAALISAAVTGKIDLRAHFAQSLSEPETA